MIIITIGRLSSDSLKQIYAIVDDLGSWQVSAGVFRRAGRLASWNAGHRFAPLVWPRLGQAVQQDVQVGLFDLLAVLGVLGGDPEPAPLVPQQRPLLAESGDGPVPCRVAYVKLQWR